MGVGCVDVDSSTLSVNNKVESNRVRWRESVGGSGGVNVSGSGGLSNHACPGGAEIIFGVLVPDSAECTGVSKFGPFSTEIASSRRECRRCSCELMKGAECRSPVHRVMATMSRDWLRRVRRVVRGERRSGCVVLRVRFRGAWVRRRRASVYFM
jgi:hypothetical protein